MGFPAQSLVHRMDNKLYKLQVCVHVCTRAKIYPELLLYLFSDSSISDSAAVPV